MGETVIGPVSEAYPKPTTPIIVQLKPRWSDEWRWATAVNALSATACAAGQDLDSCHLRRRYGLTKEIWASGFSEKDPWNLMGWWVRLHIFGDQGFQEIWRGQIAVQTRQPHGSTAHGPSGVQNWTAYGPQKILMKTQISTALHQKSPNTFADVASTIKWMPAMNADPGTGMPGNATAAVFDGVSKIFGHEALWTNHEFLTYVLKRFVQQDDGPVWTIGGQTEILDDLEETIALGKHGHMGAPDGAVTTAAAIVRKLIPTKMGIDYVIVPTADGFEIFVYALHALAYSFSFSGASLPKNPSTVVIQSSQTTDNISTVIQESAEQTYRTIRILGRRIVVCCSLGGAQSTHLVGKWDAAAETRYKVGSGIPADPGEVHDKVRQSDRFDAVYQHFGVIPDAVPWIVPDLTPFGELGPYTPNKWQTEVRATLNWTPLRANVDYTTVPSTDPNPGMDHHAELLPPACYVRHALLFNPSVFEYTPAEKFSIGIAAPRQDWGVHLSSNPNHRMADGHFDDANPTAQRAVYDYDQIIATIAYESDQRLALEYTVPDVGQSQLPPAGDGVKVIEQPDAEMWILAPNTVVGIDGDHQLKISPSEPQVLRSDADRMALPMAGAIARYTVPRASATITIKGIEPWNGLLGQILTVVDEGGSLQSIQSPITSVSWTMGKAPQTVIQTGFAE